MEKRGVQKSSINIDNTRVMIQCYFPLNEIVIDFHDTLKSITSGFGSFSYEDHGYELSNLVKVIQYIINLILILILNEIFLYIQYIIIFFLLNIFTVGYFAKWECY
jgi:translation elongation factor EF-4